MASAVSTREILGERGGEMGECRGKFYVCDAQNFQGSATSFGIVSSCVLCETVLIPTITIVATTRGGRVLLRERK